MKKLKFKSIMIIIFSCCMLLVGCNNSSIPVGEYTFEDIVYNGALSSKTLNAQMEDKSGTEYTIKNDYLSIANKNGVIEYRRIKFVREKLTDDFIRNHYATQDERLTKFFAKYEIRFRYSLYNEQGKQLNTYLFQMDHDLFISEFARNDILIFSIDKMILKSE